MLAGVITAIGLYLFVGLVLDLGITLRLLIDGACRALLVDTASKLDESPCRSYVNFMLMVAFEWPRFVYLVIRELEHPE